MFRLHAQQRARIPLIIAVRLWRFYLQIFTVLHAEAAPVPLSSADKAVEAQPARVCPEPRGRVLGILPLCCHQMILCFISKVDASPRRHLEKGQGTCDAPVAVNFG